MLSFAVAVVAYLAVTESREAIRPMPTITNSLVNLGKMEISFYFNGNRRDSSSHQPGRSPSHRKLEPIVEEPCPCSSLRNVKNGFLSNPTGLLNKILLNNDLFSFNKEPLTSTLCCESHEHVQEGTVIFEYPVNPKKSKLFTKSNYMPVQSKPVPIANNPMPMMPFIFDTLLPNKPMLPLKTKSIEIFLFPKKKETFNGETQKSSSKNKDLISKDSIQIVGDKEINDNISLFKPVLPVIKKDLTLQEKNEKEKQTEKEQEKEQENEKIEDKEKLEGKEKQETEKQEIRREEGDRIIIEPGNKPNAV